MTVPIVSRERVKRAVDDALNGSCYGDEGKAIAHAAAALCLPVQAVVQALQPADAWCCPQGENLGVLVCDECTEICAAYQGCLGPGNNEPPKA